MKIAVISTDSHRLHGLAGALNTYHVTLREGAPGQLCAVAGLDAPDVAVLDGTGDLADLTQIEMASTRFPKMAIVLLCPAPTPGFLLSAMRAGVCDVLPSAVAPQALLDTLQRIAAKSARREATRTGKILAFMSCKGGSGATFIATNLGYQLAHDKKVLLIDLNLQFGDALSFLHDEKPRSTIADLARDIGRLDARLLATSAIEITPNYSILAAPEAPEQASRISAAHIDAILTVALANYDFVLVDLNRALDAPAIKVLERAERIYTVLHASLPALSNAVKLLACLQSLGYAEEKLAWIVNRFEKGSQIGLDDVRRALATERLAVVGNAAKDVTRSLNLGRPMAQVARRHPVTKNLTELMLAIAPAPFVRRGLFDRLFKRV